LLPNSVVPFLEYFDQAPEPGHIGKAITELFQKGLANCFESAEFRTMSLGYIRDEFERARDGSWWSSVLEGVQELERGAVIVADFRERERILMRFPYRTVFDCFGGSRRVSSGWSSLFPGACASYAHGDLNPRNVLMVRSEAGLTPVLIDFHRFGGPVPLMVDFCRLEAGVCVKALKRVIESTSASSEVEDELVTFANTVNELYAFWRRTSVFGRLGVSHSPIVYKAALTVQSIRESYTQCAPARALEEDRAYFGTLFLYYLNYLRPLYRHRLTLRQRLYSLFCAAGIFERHFMI
jgi:hypothetical protein